MERFITPYMFALTDCHVRGEFCWFPGQISAPSTTGLEHFPYCDMYQCTFLLNEQTDDFVAVDEYTLAKQFPSKALGREYLSYHWDNFVKKLDVQTLAKAGVTHVRVPMPHWIMGDIREGEPWIDGQWLYFVRFVGWCREYGIQVWTDIHTAPGSQNGFDNSGQLLQDAPTCRHWTSSPENVERSLQAVRDIAKAVVRDNLEDVVTGFGVLNEPFSDCDPMVVKQFYNDALKAVRTTMSEDTAVYIGDLFNATSWNNLWWTDEDRYHDTYLDSHYYHVFDGTDRKLSPKQHIALVCGKDARATAACCYNDAPKNTIPSRGISRLVGEWSASYDMEPSFVLHALMSDIKKTKGDSSNFQVPSNRSSSEDRELFLRNFVEAQMVVYETPDEKEDGVGVSSGWFFWTLKMEFSIFAEWDFLRGYREGWIPKLPSPSESSQSIFGTCREIAARTKDDAALVTEYPDPKTHPDLWHGPPADDDFVVSHADSIATASEKSKATGDKTTKPTSTPPKEKDETSKAPSNQSPKPVSKQDQTKTSTTVKKDEKSNEDGTYSSPTKSGLRAWFPAFCLVFFAWGIWKVFLNEGNVVRNRRQYTNLDAPTQLIV